LLKRSTGRDYFNEDPLHRCSGQGPPILVKGGVQHLMLATRIKDARTDRALDPTYFERQSRPFGE
jgi:hypothetical protein